METIYDGARPDEEFHIQFTQPTCTGWGRDWLFRRVNWHMEHGRFRSYILFWFIRWYRGTVKCDGTRTHAWQASGHHGEYVMTTTPRELASFRLRWAKPDRERWDNMGGI